MFPSRSQKIEKLIVRFPKKLIYCSKEFNIKMTQNVTIILLDFKNYLLQKDETCYYQSHYQLIKKNLISNKIQQGLHKMKHSSTLFKKLVFVLLNNKRQFDEINVDLILT